MNNMGNFAECYYEGISRQDCIDAGVFYLVNTVCLNSEMKIDPGSLYNENHPMHINYFNRSHSVWPREGFGKSLTDIHGDLMDSGRLTSFPMAIGKYTRQHDGKWLLTLPKPMSQKSREDINF